MTERLALFFKELLDKRSRVLGRARKQMRPVNGPNKMTVDRVFNVKKPVLVGQARRDFDQIRPIPCNHATPTLESMFRFVPQQLPQSKQTSLTRGAL